MSLGNHFKIQSQKTNPSYGHAVKVFSETTTFHGIENLYCIRQRSFYRMV